MRIVKVYRPESAVNDPTAINSFKDLPFIDDHEMLSGFEGDEENTAPEDKGVDGVITSNVYYEAPWMRGDLKVFSRKLQKTMSRGKKDLSLGYDCDFLLEPGVWNGEPYEVLQTNLRGNHIALVREGRVAGARVLDGRCFDHLSFDFKPSDEEEPMPKAMDKAARDSAVEQLKQLIPALSKALESFLQEEGTEPAHQEASQPAATGEPTVASQIEGGEQQADNGANATTEGGEATNAGGEGEGEGGADLAGLIAQAKAVLANLEGAVQGNGGEGGNGEANDNVEGLATNSDVKGAQVSTDQSETEGKGAADSEGEPAPANQQKAQDAALSRFYSDLALKDRFYQRLSTVVGAFDHKAMDSRAVVVYGVKKLGIKCQDGMEQFALDAYLNGVEKANSTTRQQTATRAADAANPSPELDKYLKGE